MNIKGQIVVHKTFGAGTVIKAVNDYIVILFSIGEKSFQFPEAFVLFLKAEDNVFSQYVENLIEEQNKQKIIECEKRRLENWSNIKKLGNETQLRYKKMARANIAFKCNFCDGGKSDKQVGFHGVCSDVVINNNIAVEHRTWCSSDESACLDYYNKKDSNE